MNRKSARPASPSRVQRESKQDREQQHLQDVALREGVDDGGGDDAEQHVGHALGAGGADVLRDRAGIERGGIHVHPGAGPDHVDHQQPDHERQRRDHLEIHQRQPTGLADGFHVADTGHAGDDGAEDDRRDHHPHELDEAIAERLHRRARLRIEVPQRDAGRRRDEHLSVQRSVEGLTIHRAIYSRPKLRRIEKGVVPLFGTSTGKKAVRPAFAWASMRKS